MIRDNVKQICKYQGRKLSEIAEALNITRQSLHRFITGSPNLETIQKIARVLGVPEFILLHPEPVQALKAWNARKDHGQTNGRPDIFRLLCPICGGRLQVEIRPDDSSSQDQQHDRTNDAGNMEQPEPDATATEGNKD